MTTTVKATDAQTILALDLGKCKSVACAYPRRGGQNPNNGRLTARGLHCHPKLSGGEAR